MGPEKGNYVIVVYVIFAVTLQQQQQQPERTDFSIVITINCRDSSVEVSVEEQQQTYDENGRPILRRRTSSQGSMGGGRRSRASCSAMGGAGSLVKKALNKTMHNRFSRDETSGDRPL